MKHWSSLEIFAGISTKSRALLSDDLIRYFKTGDQIMGEQSSGTSLVVLISGQVRVSAGGTYLVTRLAGEIIGEQSILNSAGRSATVVAEGMVEAVVIPTRTAELLLTDVAFCQNLARAISKKLRDATEQRSVRYRREEQLFTEFSAHVSPEIASRLLASGEDYGKPRFLDVVLLMADIRSFTDASNRMTPQDIASDLSVYLDLVVAIVHRHEAMVDKFIGDAVLAVWGVASPIDESTAGIALSAAKEMVRAALTLKFGGAPIRIGVGLNAGRVFAGNVGNNTKRQFTVLGTAVNIAARLEAECKALNAPIVVSDVFAKHLSPGDLATLQKHENVVLRGIGAQTLYSLSCVEQSAMGGA